MFGFVVIWFCARMFGMGFEARLRLQLFSNYQLLPILVIVFDSAAGVSDYFRSRCCCFCGYLVISMFEELNTSLTLQLLRSTVIRGFAWFRWILLFDGHNNLFRVSQGRFKVLLL